MTRTKHCQFAVGVIVTYLAVTPTLASAGGGFSVCSNVRWLTGYASTLGGSSSNCRIGIAMCVNDTADISFSASPTSGYAPLGVQFYATIGNQYSIDFGDGQTGTLISPCGSEKSRPPVGRSDSVCPPPGAHHTYAIPGKYLATLRLVTSCPEGALCDKPAPVVVVTITVAPRPAGN